MSLTTATYILATAFIAAALLCLYAALSGAEWFFRSTGVRMLTGSLSRPLSRILYAILALAILFMTHTLLTSPTTQ